MANKYLRKYIRRIKRWRRQKISPLMICAVVIGIGLVAYGGYMQYKRHYIDPTAYRPLLHLIGKAESNNNYNAYFGNANNTEIKFTDMSIAEVLAWQSNFVNQGSPSSAVGRYQIINTTLSGLVDQLDLDASQKFDEATQDALAIALLERRGAQSFAGNQLSREEFAASLAKEWAALPRVVGENPDQSYYASDGLNRSRVKVQEILAVIDGISTR